MASASQNSGQFLTSLYIEDLPGGKVRILRPLVYRTAAGNRITVPKNFVCDKTSSLLKRRGDHDIAAVVHDWLYASGMVSRRQADAIYREAMDSLGVNPVTRWTYWTAVRAFGWRPWRTHRARARDDQAQRDRDLGGDAAAA